MEYENEMDFENRMVAPEYAPEDAEVENPNRINVLAWHFFDAIPYKWQGHLQGKHLLLIYQPLGSSSHSTTICHSLQALQKSILPYMYFKEILAIENS